MADRNRALVPASATEVWTMELHFLKLKNRKGLVVYASAVS